MDIGLGAGLMLMGVVLRENAGNDTSGSFPGSISEKMISRSKRMIGKKTCTVD